jgi:hypothetical protein
MSRTFRSLAFAGAAVVILAPAAVSAATPVDNGCPAANPPISVAQLEASGPYQLPRRLDDPANGGNGDGWVCAFALPDAIFGGGLGFTYYQFHENNLPAEGRP